MSGLGAWAVTDIRVGETGRGQSVPSGQGVEPGKVAAGEAFVSPRQEYVAVVPAIELNAHQHLLLIRRARTCLRLLPRLIQRREQHRSENGNNCDHHQKFNQSERVMPFREMSPSFLFKMGWLMVDMVSP